MPAGLTLARCAPTMCCATNAPLSQALKRQPRRVCARRQLLSPAVLRDLIVAAHHPHGPLWPDAGLRLPSWRGVPQRRERQARLRHAYASYPFRYLNAFRACEREARDAARGLWAASAVCEPLADRTWATPGCRGGPAFSVLARSGVQGGLLLRKRGSHLLRLSDANPGRNRTAFVASSCARSSRPSICVFRSIVNTHSVSTHKTAMSRDVARTRSAAGENARSPSVPENRRQLAYMQRLMRRCVEQRSPAVSCSQPSHR